MIDPRKGAKMEYMVFTDVEGRPFTVECLSLYEQLKRHSFKLFGFDIPSILELRRQYCLRLGPLEATLETVREAFRVTP